MYMKIRQVVHRGNNVSKVTKCTKWGKDLAMVHCNVLCHETWGNHARLQNKRGTNPEGDKRREGCGNAV